jgi:hypothetical protein
MHGAYIILCLGYGTLGLRQRKLHYSDVRGPVPPRSGVMNAGHMFFTCITRLEMLHLHRNYR